ncbi:LysR family transcriptional regulator [Pseudolysobacter antarcticus]|uniref:LysR family transcriptional regulator n=1 Tax=Pseudolysobacter antarcticus TaxID=2511995 RepID=A0A411HFG7_9GAMM|nr:LysR family transcriptional regulator [Pseudolysobacter antarcticus]QBB69194.1 LysR family transcriptional regulator [Pseudolysobacter antarcticus]
MDRFHLLNIFVAVVDNNGFSGAARKLNISPPATTRAVNELENHLGLRLLIRTTRIVRVTEAGARYADDCRRILGELAQADASASGMHGAPRGRLVLTAPVLFGNQFVTAIVTEYLRRYPDVSATCLFLDRVVNMLDEGVDVAVRIGELPDSSMQAIRVGQVRRVICGAPAYFKKHGVPKTPEDLPRHSIISANSVTPTPEWRLVKNGAAHIVKLQPRLSTSTNAAAATAAINGFGLTQLLSYQVAEYLRAGKLKVVLEKFEPVALPVHVVHREGRHATKTVRAFLDLIIERLRADPALR